MSVGDEKDTEDEEVKVFVIQNWFQPEDCVPKLRL